MEFYFSIFLILIIALDLIGFLISVRVEELDCNLVLGGMHHCGYLWTVSKAPPLGGRFLLRAMLLWF
jgi:hypothetical protein